jgi:hypothetical protein
MQTDPELLTQYLLDPENVRLPEEYYQSREHDDCPVEKLIREEEECHQLKRQNKN